ncbi:hypothetical protein NK553_18260 [Pseudomonas sp. ZM23]|uniref:Uncharacterized protein n=1 Tax=Pseudomonas triclosanedens TaxID=2961893 RepID=A0ABY6ZRT0_9PSED|nr:hypothetical protein [Pseudomonas triclosanedens]MCP8465898.1 hypothetical protein [Pseudomonas triclosanedens]MCP8472219.1 hypothetical protein [Pseudomonas triclosanedens]MCP8477197.1 hypothetical protein [Pseudomonas triclosanedens]WAI47465.1 hypothetical protein OU419_16955 [Pseudomonas triclosanedens]
MLPNRSSEELRVTLDELSFQQEAAALVLEGAVLELPSRMGGNVSEVVDLLRRQAATLRSLSARVTAGDIEAHR